MADDFVTGFPEAEVTLEGPYEPDVVPVTRDGRRVGVARLRREKDGTVTADVTLDPGECAEVTPEAVVTLGLEWWQVDGGVPPP